MSGELDIKNKLVREYLKKNNLDGVLISKISNFAWMTGGKNNCLRSSSDVGVATLFFAKKNKYLITNNIELKRIINEEDILKQGYKVRQYGWWTPGRKDEIITKFKNSSRIASDIPLAGAKTLNSNFYELQYSLVNEEIKRYMELGKNTGIILGNVCKGLRKGLSENEIAARVNGGFKKSGIDVVVNLVAVDSRILKYRHPIPTKKVLKKHVVISVCARKYGLIVSATRIVHFGRIPDSLKKKHNAVAKVDTVFILNSHAGSRVNDILRKVIKVYKETGYGNEWRLHHQGGPTGYNTRDYLATPGNKTKLLLNQAVAWNPTILGTKSEDTIIVCKDGPKIISESPGWPVIEVDYNGKTLKRPNILIK